MKAFEVKPFRNSFLPGRFYRQNVMDKQGYGGRNNGAETNGQKLMGKNNGAKTMEQKLMGKNNGQKLLGEF